LPVRGGEERKKKRKKKNQASRGLMPAPELQGEKGEKKKNSVEAEKRSDRNDF